MKKVLTTMLPDTPLVKNLENRHYMEMILKGRASLEERFAEIDSNTIREEMKKAKIQNEGIPRKLKKIITKHDFPGILIEVLFIKTELLNPTVCWGHRPYSYSVDQNAHSLKIALLHQRA